MTWYEASEFRDEVKNGTRRQPEFPPPPTEGYDETEGGRAPGMEALETRMDEIVTIIEDEIENGPEAVG